MTHQETIAVIVVVAVVAYIIGGARAQSKAAPTVVSSDPLAWLNWANPS